MTSFTLLFIKRNIGAWSDKFKDLLFKSTNGFRISNFIIALTPLNNSGWKKSSGSIHV